MLWLSFIFSCFAVVVDVVVLVVVIIDVVVVVVAVVVVVFVVAVVVVFVVVVVGLLVLLLWLVRTGSLRLTRTPLRKECCAHKPRKEPHKENAKFRKGPHKKSTTRSKKPQVCFWCVSCGCAVAPRKEFGKKFFPNSFRVLGPPEKNPEIIPNYLQAPPWYAILDCWRAWAAPGLPGTNLQESHEKRTTIPQ